ncbi:MAG TPA: hypothetical protein VKZ60_17330 [Chloroflexota bacterium]|nr:hypothetical protein [Chloroflexota bacterium]
MFALAVTAALTAPGPALPIAVVLGRAGVGVGLALLWTPASALLLCAPGGLLPWVPVRGLPLQVSGLLWKLRPVGGMATPLAPAPPLALPSAGAPLALLVAALGIELGGVVAPGLVVGLPLQLVGLPA